MINKIVMTLATLAFASVAAAAEDGFKISGDIATSVFTESGKGYNASNGYINGGAPNAGSSENDGDFSVDLMEIQLEKAMGNSGVVVGIGYGRMFNHINGIVDENGPTAVTPKGTLNLTNAYFHHKLGDTGLSFKLGKFGSGVGYENYNYMSNMNYTRSYAFHSMNPWFFTGLSADYTINDMVSVGAVVANTTGNSDVDDNESKVMGVNATIKAMEGLTFKLNYLTGREGGREGTIANYYDTTRLNVTAMYTMNNMYDFAIHYSDLSKEKADDASTLADEQATSIALYAGAKMEMWGAGLRYEMVTNDDDLIGTAGTNPGNDISVITATGWYNIDQNAVLKLEIAQTSTDEQTLFDDAYQADDSMMAYGLGFMYRF